MDTGLAIAGAVVVAVIAAVTTVFVAVRIRSRERGSRPESPRETPTMPAWGTAGFAVAVFVLVVGFLFQAGSSDGGLVTASEPTPLLGPAAWIAVAAGFLLGLTGLVVRELRRR